ncbi:MAG: DUF6599 family protein [Candidatus Latescibacterota bacterium]
MNRKMLLILPAVLMATFFLLSAAAAAEEAKFLKGAPAGFTAKEPVSFFNRNNLYEYINGQAVFYNSYGFTRLEHGVYGKGGGTYTVDIYELGSGLSSFGAFRQQREEEAADHTAGAESALIEYLTVFYKDKYYVEIIPLSGGNDDVGAMKELAAWVDGALPGSKALPPELALFPASGLIPKSERYVDESLISYSFMGRGLTATYKAAGQEKEARIFIGFAPDQEKAKEIFTGFGSKMTNTQTVKIGDAAGVKGELPYRGLSIACQSGSFVYGCMGVSDEKQATELLGTLGENLKKYASSLRGN